ncbi:carbohydrate kinase family protein [Ruania halotolerans]|uniref:carbohydrate kinase family protein n=1 Tax=Ruania halotolerans TaxID=2897773 RepID=UPI001E4582EB|nr:PfkB family carbohydrate kinase [Ruania halotolerans]UFU07973.1 PfkB family carbohydrate kinase [Ruania halotolerans]
MTSPPNGRPPHVVVLGDVFVDLVLAGLAEPPVAGREVYALDSTLAPGGSGNHAVALARLGVRTRLVSALGDDDLGLIIQRQLRSSGVLLEDALHCERSHVTVSLSSADDRALATYLAPEQGPVEPAPEAPWADGVVLYLSSTAADGTWWRTASAQGSRVYADIGWDPSGEWAVESLEPLAHCHAFLPNEQEARAYTRTDTPRAAAAALTRHVPVVVLTCGRDGALAIDQRTGEEARVPALAVDAVDPTGAGDVFVGGFVTADLLDLPLTDRLAFATLTAGLAVRRLGGSLAAPTVHELSRWWQQLRTTRGSDQRDLQRRYEFLEDLLPRLIAGQTGAPAADEVPA